MGRNGWIAQITTAAVLSCGVTLAIQCPAATVTMEENGKLQPIGGDFKTVGPLGVLFGVKFVSDMSESGKDNICAVFIKNTSPVCPTQEGEMGQVVQKKKGDLRFDYASATRVMDANGLPIEVDFTEPDSTIVSDRVQAWMDKNGLFAVTWSSDKEPNPPPPPPPPTAPEPGSILLLGTGIVGIARLLKKRL